MSDLWTPISKGDVRGRKLADRHYTRQTPGHYSWTRPGYNYCLLGEFPEGEAVFVWWRPKWEDGRPGTTRKDKLLVLECTIFRREGVTPRASELILAAEHALQWDAARTALQLDNAGPVSGLLTGVASAKTRQCRSKTSLPGACYRHAGWHEIVKRKAKADVWLFKEWSNPWCSTDLPTSTEENL